MTKNNQKLGIGVVALLIVVALCIVPVSANLQHSSGNSGTFSFTQAGGIVENSVNSGSLFLGSPFGYSDSNGNTGTLGGFQTLQTEFSGMEVTDTFCSNPQPVAAQTTPINFEFTLNSTEGFSPSYTAVLSRGQLEIELDCEVEQVHTNESRTYACTSDFDFWYPPGAYDVHVRPTEPELNELFLISRDTGPPGSIHYTETPDSIGSWVQLPDAFSRVVYLFFVENKLFAFPEIGNEIAISEDGFSWQTVTYPGSNINVKGAIYDGTNIIALGSSRYWINSSDLGLTWSYNEFANTGIMNFGKGIAYGNGVYIAVGGAGNSRIARSTNAQTWSAISNHPFTDVVQGVAYGDGVFVAVGENGEIARSNDGGLSWQLINTLTFSNYNIGHVAFANGMFVASARSPGTRIATSVDGGLTWIQSSVSSTSFHGYGNLVYADNRWLGLHNSRYVVSNADATFWQVYIPSFLQMSSIVYAPFDVGLDYEEQSVCTYGQLIAGQRETNAVSFANSGTNVQSDQPFVVRNVGNMPIDVTVRAYDLYDGSQIVLPASNFQIGETQQTATTLVNAEYIAISQIQPGENAVRSYWMWANIVPTANPPFRATNPWQMLAVGE